MDSRMETLIRLPIKQKLLIIVLIVILEGLLFYFSFFAPRKDEYVQLSRRLTALRGEVAEKQRIADNLPQLKHQFDLLNLDLRHALTELPNQKEIPTLLTGITSAGKAAGLDFLIFRPKSEDPKDFYASVPVDISVAGTYHEVAEFFNSVGNLPRIVNIGNVSFADIREAGGRNLVRVNCLATTFRFLEKKEIPNEPKNK